MCSGGTYWAGIGRGVYGMTEKRLAELTGDNPENLTIDMPCHRVFDAGQRKVEVVGPFAELEAEIARVHEGFWWCPAASCNRERAGSLAPARGVPRKAAPRRAVARGVAMGKARRRASG